MQKIQAITAPFGFQRIRLDGVVTLAASSKPEEPPGLIWQPTPQAVQFLTLAPAHRFGQTIVNSSLKEVGWTDDPGVPRILCRIRLRAPMIWTGKDQQRAYLNAEHLGVNGTVTKRELELDARDPQAAADLDMFIYLKAPPPRQAPPAPAQPGTVLVDLPPILGTIGTIGAIGNLGTIAAERVPKPVRGIVAAAGARKSAAGPKPKPKPKRTAKGKPKPAK